MSLSSPNKSLLGYPGKGGWKRERQGREGQSVGVYNLGRGIFNEGRSLQVTSSSPLSSIFPQCGGRNPSGWTKQQISTLALEDGQAGSRGNAQANI